MARLFQDEPDEDTGPELFQIERDEPHKLFQDEPEERPPPFRAFGTTKDAGLDLLQDEPDEAPHRPALFGAEEDECDSGNQNSDSDSAYWGDCEKDTKQDNYAIVQLNFSTINKFLCSQMSSADPKIGNEPVKKKRRYNNKNRSKAAEAKRANKPAVRKRVPRNCPDTCPTETFLFSVHSFSMMSHV